MSEFSPAQAYWNQRHVLADCRDRILALLKAIDRPVDLFLRQAAQLMASALEFAPDIILDLGRGYGNSTCAFTEAANRLEPHNCRVLSLDRTDVWNQETVPKLSEIVPESWFEPLQAVEADIVTFDYTQALAGFEKILVFWDAHGYEVAECILGQILPLIASRPHVVIVHDLLDARYIPAISNSYGELGLWMGGAVHETPPRMVRLNNVVSLFEEAVAITDFASRNGLPLHSADHSLHTEFGDDPARVDELQELIGDQLFSLNDYCNWFWFSLNEIPGPYTFPRLGTSDEVIKHLRFARNYPALFSEVENLGLDDHEASRGLRLAQDYLTLLSELEAFGLDDHEAIQQLGLLKNYPVLCSYLTNHPALVSDLESVKREFGRLPLKSRIGLALHVIWKALRGKYNLREGEEN